MLSSLRPSTWLAGRAEMPVRGVTDMASSPIDSTRCQNRRRAFPLILLVGGSPCGECPYAPDGIPNLSEIDITGSLRVGYSGLLEAVIGIFPERLLSYVRPRPFVR